MDSLRLFRPIAYQLPPYLTKASELLIRGGNRSCKSLTGAAIVASAARQVPIYGPDNRPLPMFCPTGRPLTIWVIGKGEDHIADTLHRLLFLPDQIPLVRDSKTGKVRAARDWQEKDLGKEQKLIAPPLIPEYDVAGGSYDKAIAWNNKKSRFFSSCEMANGTMIHAFTSSGEVKMGDPVDLIWIDEDILYPNYVGEWQARLSDRRGRLIWTAWPWADNYALVKMSQRAHDQKDRPEPDVFEMKLSFRDNPLIHPDEKRKRYEAWSHSGSDELKSRVDGEFAIGLSLMYPSFSLAIHGVPQERPIGGKDRLGEAIAKAGGVPPRDWTRYMAMDPGHAYCACVFFAVPPQSEFGDHVVVYDELYMQAMDAETVAKKIHEKLAGVVMQDFIIDRHFARQSVAGMGGTTHGDIYAAALAKRGVRSVASGSDFTLSNSEVESGCEMVRTWMAIRSDGTPKLRVIGEHCPNLLAEIQMYRKSFQKEEARDKPMAGQKDHACDAMRYGIMGNLEYLPVPNAQLYMADDPVMSWFKREHKQQAPQRQTTFTCGSGAVSAA